MKLNVRASTPSSSPRLSGTRACRSPDAMRSACTVSALIGRATWTPCSAASTTPIASTTSETIHTRWRDAVARASESASDFASSASSPAVVTPTRSTPTCSDDASPVNLIGAPYTQSEPPGVMRTRVTPLLVVPPASSFSSSFWRSALGGVPALYVAPP